MDPNQGLLDLLGRLDIQHSSAPVSEDIGFSEPLSNFHVFPNLPIELRLKIWAQALPEESTLELTAVVGIAVPDFGLMLDFKIRSPVARFSIFQQVSYREKWYHLKRRLSILAVNNEARNVYLEKFNLSLPSADRNSRSQTYRPEGKIRYSPKETIYIKNMLGLGNISSFREALRDNWRVHDSWNQIEILKVDVIALATARPGQTDAMMGERVQLLRSLKGLKVLKAQLWEPDYADWDGNKVESHPMYLAFKQLLESIEQCLRELKETDETVIIPRLELVTA